MIAVAGWLIWLKAGFTVARLPLARDQEAERRSRHVLVDKVGLFHSARMLWALITPAQRLVSSATYLPKSSGDIGRGTSPVLAVIDEVAASGEEARILDAAHGLADAISSPGFGTPVPRPSAGPDTSAPAPRSQVE